MRVTHVPTGTVVSGEGLSVYGVREQLLKELREKVAEKKPTHGGTWDVRLQEAQGKIGKEEADRLVRELRTKRKRAGKKD